MIEPIRLLGFAFASADLLFEIDREGTILFAAGAISLFSADPKLKGRSAAELFQPSEHSHFVDTVRGLGPGGRVGPLPTLLASGEKASLSMCFLPQSDRISCTLVKPGKRGSIGGGAKDAETGLADKDAFLSAAAENAGSRGAMAMVNVPNLPDVCAKLSAPDAAKLMAGIGANINAMGALIAARLSQTRFGVVTEDPHGARNLAQRIQDAARERGVGSLQVQEVLLSLKGRNLTPEQTVLALRYAVMRFTDGTLKAVSSADLAETFDRMMEETIARAQTFNTTVADGAFDLAFEPIVDLKTGTPSHYEALTRFQEGQSPAETIKFAEDLGLMDAFDVAVALKAFAILEANSAITASIAINVSGRTFADPSAFAALAGLLSKKRAFAKRVLVEITESAEVPDIAAADKAIQSLRQMGYRVGIDDFGAGAASLQYLHGFTIDFVKMDGSVIQRMGKSPREDALLKSVLTTCAELKIETVAEWIDSPEKLQRCRDIGFHCGQGRHFGPSLTELPQSSHLRVRRKGETVSWG
ncbi:MAG TPA: EAL domain-containing protein [Micropepsaceae bacterium]|jgi:EAL domain-containing protein (putative c-di-GMP-specific phosphodiesterase class I)|nr:EAL domain-containing protein [Micropepsaceae bacterium]